MEASDFHGEPPVDHLLPIMLVLDPCGAIKTISGDVVPLELWPLNEAAGSLAPARIPMLASRPERQDRPSSGEPTTTWPQRQRRARPAPVERFGERGNGSVTADDGGSCNYGSSFRAVGDNGGEFRALVPSRTVLAPGGCFLSVLHRAETRLRTRSPLSPDTASSPAPARRRQRPALGRWDCARLPRGMPLVRAGPAPRAARHVGARPAGCARSIIAASSSSPVPVIVSGSLPRPGCGPRAVQVHRPVPGS